MIENPPQRFFRMEYRGVNRTQGMARTWHI